MPKISDHKKEKIKELILSVLFDNSPKSLYTSKIADEIIRDEEFTLIILEELYKKKLIKRITKNNKGEEYLARKKWQLTTAAYDAYKKLLE